MGAAVTPDPDPLKIGTIPVFGAVSADFQVAVLFSNPLPIGGLDPGPVIKLTAYNAAGVLKDYNVSGDPNFRVPDVFPTQLGFKFDAIESPATRPLPSVYIDNTAGNLVDAANRPVASGTVSLIDIDLE